MEAWAKAGGGRGCGCREKGWVEQADLRGPLKSEEKGGLPLGGNREPEKVRRGRQKPVQGGSRLQEVWSGAGRSLPWAASLLLAWPVHPSVPCTHCRLLHHSPLCSSHSLCPFFFHVPFCLSVCLLKSPLGLPWCSSGWGSMHVRRRGHRLNLCRGTEILACHVVRPKKRKNLKSHCHFPSGF